MAQYLVLHEIDLPHADLKKYTSEAMPAVINNYLDACTEDTYVVTSWLVMGIGKTFCMWEAPSEQAIIDVLAKVSDGLPSTGIYPMAVIDWAEMKKAMGK